jgi:glucokinase
MILAGDLGGTHSRLAVFDVRAGQLASVWARTYPSREHSGVGSIVRAALADARVSVTGATFGIAGPVRNRRVQTTNLPWVVDAAELERELGLARVDLINDLEANAHGLLVLGPSDFETLHSGDPAARGNIALIAAGTGLGEAGLYFDGQSHHPFACEGGHTDFAPVDDEQVELWRVLRARYGHVSYERLISGPGLVNIYQFLRDRARQPDSPALAQEIASGDAAAAIATAAQEGTSPLAVRALEIFIALYGAEAGNLALKIMATGGVYLGGGIAPKSLPWLKRPGFLEAFFAKGRLRPVLESMPVRVIMNDQTALLGAARHAARTAHLLP